MFSGLVDILNANEVETFVLLVGCRELVDLGAIWATIEGDSFSTI